jgi:hypothetical protein
MNLNEIVIAVIKIFMYLGLVGFFSYLFYKTIWNGWSKRYKFYFKYFLLRKNYPEKTVEFCLDCIENNRDYYSIKKSLIINNWKNKDINEILWIYDMLLKQMKGGKNKNERKFAGISNEIERKQEFPKFTSSY